MCLLLCALSEVEKHGDPDTAENVAYEARAGPTTAINPSITANFSMCHSTQASSVALVLLLLLGQLKLNTRCQ